MRRSGNYFQKLRLRLIMISGNKVIVTFEIPNLYVLNFSEDKYSPVPNYRGILFSDKFRHPFHFIR